MMRKDISALLLGVMLFLPVGIFSQNGAAPADSTGKKVAVIDPWCGFDKVQHFTYSFLWTLSTQYILETKFEVERETAAWISPISAAGAGLAKELYDRKTPEDYFSKRDLIADLAGITLAMVIIVY